MKWHKLDGGASVRPDWSTSKWTDERTQFAVKSWKDGISAAQIARMLGGVTRNAVIGKIHRMGAATDAPRHKRSTKGRPRSRIPQHRPHRRFTSDAAIAARAALRTQIDDHHAAQIGPDLIVPPDQRKTLMQLSASNCRWPFGDPKEADFHFCHHKAIPGQPYCDFHCKRAFAPPNYRPRESNVPVHDRATPVLREFDAMERA